MEAADTPEGEEKPPEPKAKAPVALVLVVGVLTMGAAAGGAVLGLRLAAPMLAAGTSQEAHAEKPSDEEAKEVLTAKFEPIVVDTRTEDGTVHHLKVGLSFELTEGSTPEQFEKMSARGREAATIYLRSQKFEDMVGQFGKVRQELGQQIIEAMGKERIARVLVTDFVAQ